MMTSGQGSDNVDIRRRRIVYLVPIFLAAMTIGFILEVFAYEFLNFAQLRKAVVNFPERWKSALSYRPVGQKDLKYPDHSLKKEVAELGRKSHFKITEEKELWEQQNLLNLKNFTWVINNVNICKVEDPQKTRLLSVLVHTARNHFRERLAIRRSYGSIPRYKKWTVRLIFLLGEADRGYNPNINQQQYEVQESELHDEQLEYGDLVIGTFIDTYRNLTYKHLMGYKWILNFCPEATFVLKTDDDMFIDIMRWLDWRTTELEAKESNSSIVLKDLYCNTFIGTGPIRQKGSKWYVSEDEWPKQSYPDYCSGWAYGITVDLIRKLYSVSNDIKFFWVDDVFATGDLMEIARHKYNFTLKVKHIWNQFTTDIMAYRPLCEKRLWDDKRQFQAVAYVARTDAFQRDMICMWNKTLHDSTHKL